MKRKELTPEQRERKRLTQRAYWERNKEERNAAQREYYHRNKESIRTKQRVVNREAYKQQRIAILAKFGGRCVCCGESTEVFLDVDHVNGGGNKHRKQFRSIHSYNQFLIEEAKLEDFQILCKNCNYAKFRLGQCPHQLDARF